MWTEYKLVARYTSTKKVLRYPAFKNGVIPHFISTGTLRRHFNKSHISWVKHCLFGCYDFQDVENMDGIVKSIHKKSGLIYCTHSEAHENSLCFSASAAQVSYRSQSFSIVTTLPTRVQNLRTGLILNHVMEFELAKPHRNQNQLKLNWSDRTVVHQFNLSRSYSLTKHHIQSPPSSLPIKCIMAFALVFWVQC